MAKEISGTLIKAALRKVAEEELAPHKEELKAKVQEAASGLFDSIKSKLGDDSQAPDTP